MIKNLSELVEMAKNKPTQRLAVAAAEDEAVLQAVKSATEDNIVVPVLVGQKEKIEIISKKIGFNLEAIAMHHEEYPAEAAKKAVSLVKNGDADILMKGHVSTGPLLKAVLDKENGLRKGGTLSHVAFIESPYYHKLLGVTDAAMNIAPDLNEKADIIKNAVEGFHRLGVKNPKVAIIGAVEVVNPKMEATTDAAILSTMNRRGQIKSCEVDGPFAIDNAVSREAAEHKGIQSTVAGDADIIMLPDINAGNVAYKTLNFLGGGLSAAVIMGASVPVVLTSRADSEKSKLMSIALAAAMD
ncbi:MAG: bifunctional enoyl-CoA hydratase/phosphate acetyltransferase [Bacteroidales bacterium]|nr:bifunctional enoyl-CoA hydratase/phosphate acetyltransferase [Bacteroidales bacterium]